MLHVWKSSRIPFVNKIHSFDKRFCFPVKRNDAFKEQPFCCLYSCFLLSHSWNRSAAPFTQNRGRYPSSRAPRGSPRGASLNIDRGTLLGRGPSKKTCPRCAEHFWFPQRHSRRPSHSRLYCTLPSFVDRQKDGQPEPESYFPSESNRSIPQYAQL